MDMPCLPLDLAETINIAAVGGSQDELQKCCRIQPDA
jgi:hypothetical protein